MKKVIVTLRDPPAAAVEVPKEFPRKRGDDHESEPKEIERSIYGALRFFPRVPKTISEAELTFVEKERPELFVRLERRAYVESKRVDYRGATEAEIGKLAAAEGISHLGLKDQVRILVERKKITIPKSGSKTVLTGPAKKSGNGSKRKPIKPPE